MSTYENKWPGINSYFSFNIENFLKTYNVPGMTLGGEDQIVIETQSLLSRRKEQSLMAVDTVCYVAVRAGFSEERTFDQSLKDSSERAPWLSARGKVQTEKRAALACDTGLWSFL